MIIIIININKASSTNSTRPRVTSCTANSDCNNGLCNSNICECKSGYIKWQNGTTCGYQQSEQLTTFLLSLFVGGLGVDWFVLAKGNGGYIAAGVFKLLTGGGLGIWWLVDVIRLAVNSFNDGNGAPLKHW